jgi:GAF domain-containing protein
MIKSLLSPPVFPDNAEKTRTAKLLYQITLATASLPILAVIVTLINPSTSSYVLPAGLVLIVALLVIFGLNQSGMVTAASGVLIGTLAIVFTYLNYSNAGEPRPLILLTVIAVLMSGLLLGKHIPILIAIYLGIQHAIMVALHVNGVISPTGTVTPLQNIIVTSAGYILVGLIFNLAISRIEFTLNQVRESEASLQVSNRELKDLAATLEQRVRERTSDVERQQQFSNRRSRQFEGIVGVSRVISATKNLQEILPQITQVISEQFGFYHVGIFLNDSINQYAILSAANSEGGRKMLNRGHQLKIGEQGIVGYVTGTGHPRIALDVGIDTTYFNNPDLPLTHSEMALPLKSGNEVFGALDIQSVEQNAFTQEDVEVLEALADQVSLAIQNTRLFDQTNRLLSESEAIQKQYQRNTWGRLARENKLGGYKYTITGTTALEGDEPVIQADNSGRRAISVPISLRGENIGTLIVQVPANEKVNTDQMDLIRAVAERVALSAENARLFEETNRRAEREQVISDISAKISTSVRTENILKTTAQELNLILDGAEVLIKLGTDRNR